MDVVWNYDVCVAVVSTSNERGWSWKKIDCTGPSFRTIYRSSCHLFCESKSAEERALPAADS